MANLFAVIGLGFGDEGKGTLTDWLAAKLGAHTVVRFNGGSQAGHNVTLDNGTHHCFTQFGAGTFAGARTFLSRFMLVNPLALEAEATHLQEAGVKDPLSLVTIDREAIVTTPFHRAANRLREWKRGDWKHGSCGVGIGETVAMSLGQPELTLRCGDLQHHRIVRAKLETQREFFFEEFKELTRERVSDLVVADALKTLAFSHRFEEVFERFTGLGVRMSDRIVQRSYLDGLIESDKCVIFEGAQGVLLDEHHGYQPHTTWSDCTFNNASALCGWRPITKVGVIRTYHTRHGAGPFPTEDPELCHEEPHNALDDWQGMFRQGHLDLDLLGYAARVARGLDCLALTHLDRMPRKVCISHGATPVGTTESPRHRYGIIGSEAALIETVSGITNCPVRYTSRGPTRGAKAEL